jgi:hypothetical protein
MNVFQQVLIVAFLVTVILGFFARRRPTRSPDARPLGLISLGLLVLLLGSVVGLAMTGFPAAWRHEAVGGYVLILHVMLAGPFLFALWALSADFLCRTADADADRAREFSPCTTISYFVMAGSGIVTGATMLIAMTPMFGTHGQHALVALHRNTSVIAAFSAALFAVCLLRDVRSRRNQINATNTQ